MSQRQIARAVLTERGMARLVETWGGRGDGGHDDPHGAGWEMIRLARGLYQLPDAPLDARHSLAEAAKRVPKGVVCLVSALAFHGLTDQLPSQVWLAIAQKDARKIEPLRSSDPMLGGPRADPEDGIFGYEPHLRYR